MSDDHLNPYSRLEALEKMGVVPEFQRVRHKCVAVVGCGGIGSVAAEMLARCGIGHLILFDYDHVEPANLNRLFFRPEQCGKPKVTAAKETIASINPDVAVTDVAMNVTSPDNYDAVLALLSGGRGGVPAPQLLLCCVDNYSARIVVNEACLKLGLTWMESGVSETAVSGHIQLMVPGTTPCYACAPPLVVATGEKEPKRNGTCAASLPTTMGIIAGLIAQNALKFLLSFGTVTDYVGYDALKDHFPMIELRPNPQCTNEACRRRQAEAPVAKPIAAPAPTPPTTRSANHWGIEVTGTGEGVEPACHAEDELSPAPAAESLSALRERLRAASA